VARLRAARGRPVRGTWPARAAGRRAERKQSGEAGGRRRGFNCNFPKVQGLHCKA
jgi:hypothetical protein